jgi:predicted ester cyclase
MSVQLEQMYRAYLDTLNERRLCDLGQYLHDQVVYNGKTITWQQYAQMIADDVHNIPDLHFVIDLCVFSDDTAACRLWFECTPRARVRRHHPNRPAGHLRRACVLPLPGRPHQPGPVIDRYQRHP